jgi:hypothetical protein
LLNFLHVEEFSTEFEIDWDLDFHHLLMSLQFHRVSVLKIAQSLGILLLSLKKLLVPLRIKILVLVPMCLLTLNPGVCMMELKLRLLVVIVLNLKLVDP